MGLYSKYNSMRLCHKKFNVSYLKIVSSFIFAKRICLSFNLNNGIKTCLNIGNLSELAKLLENNWKIVSSSDSFLTLQDPDNGVIITCRTTYGYDLGHLSEIYLQKVYGENFTNMNVIDIGSSNADSVIYFAKNGAKFVIGLEPDKRSFYLADNNIKVSKVEEKVILLNKALDTNIGFTELTVYDNNPNANSIDEQNRINIKDTKHKELIEVINIEEILKMLNGEKIDLLKMDCEGCEYRVLSSIDKKIFENIEKIYLEYHNGLQNIPEILHKQGFMLKSSKNDENVGYIIAERLSA